MNKENPKKNKKSFEYYIAQRKEEFRCQYGNHTIFRLDAHYSQTYLCAITK